MADQNFMDLASKTASGIAGTDYMMLVNNSEAYKALVNDVAEAILSKLTSKSFSGLETTAKNVIGALNELNSNMGGATIRQTSNVAEFDGSLKGGSLQILWGLIDNVAYISFDISWIRLQFRIQLDVVSFRWKYGNTIITSWKEL